MSALKSANEVWILGYVFHLVACGELAEFRLDRRRQHGGVVAFVDLLRGEQEGVLRIEIEFGLDPGLSAQIGDLDLVSGPPVVDVGFRFEYDGSRQVEGNQVEYLQRCRIVFVRSSVSSASSRSEISVPSCLYTSSYSELRNSASSL